MPLHLLPIWAVFTCGGCKQPFTGNARSVPQFNDCPCCRACWDKLIALRAQLDLQPWDLPEDAYPSEG